jgi:leucyl aminopeptidase (aminopeptidase T)
MNIEERADSAQKLGRLSYLMKTARSIVTVSAWVQPGDEVVIITDGDVSPLIVQAIAGEVLIAGGVPNIVEMPIQSIHGNEPTKTAAAACMTADVIFGAVSKSITHTQAIQDALDKGHARYLGLSHVSEEVFIRGASTADPAEIRMIGEKFRSRLQKTSNVRVTSDFGMDIRFSVEGRPIRVSDGVIPHGGTWQGEKRRMFPDGECHTSPVESSFEGVIVIDRWMQGIGYVDEPIRWTMKGGKCVSIEGGTVAAALRDVIEREGDEYSYLIGEFAIGINPQARVDGNPHREGKKILGSCHFALGTGAMLGGLYRSSLHLDGVSLKPTIYIGDEMVIDHGKIIV